MESKKPTSFTNTLLLIFLILLTLVLIYLSTCHKSNVPIVDNKVPDTVWIDRPYDQGNISAEYPTIDSPDKVVRRPQQPIIRTTAILIETDTVRWWIAYPKGRVKVPEYQEVIDTARYSESFLANWPNNPKLIMNRLGKDYLSYDLLYPNGEVVTKDYSVDYNQAEYAWSDDSLRIKRHKLTLGKITKPTFHSNLYTGYNPLNKSGRLAIDGTIEYNRLGIYGRASTRTVLPYLDFEVGTKFILK